MEELDEDIEFEIVDEPWSKYKLPDGKVFEIRLILTHLKPNQLHQSEEALFDYKFVVVTRVRGLKNNKVLS